jgi:hypothetical protein
MLIVKRDKFQFVVKTWRYTSLVAAARSRCWLPRYLKSSFSFWTPLVHSNAPQSVSWHNVKLTARACKRAYCNPSLCLFVTWRLRKDDLRFTDINVRVHWYLDNPDPPGGPDNFGSILTLSFPTGDPVIPSVSMGETWDNSYSETVGVGEAGKNHHSLTAQQ